MQLGPILVVCGKFPCDIYTNTARPSTRCKQCIFAFSDNSAATQRQLCRDQYRTCEQIKPYEDNPSSSLTSLKHRCSSVTPSYRAETSADSLFSGIPMRTLSRPWKAVTPVPVARSQGSGRASSPTPRWPGSARTRCFLRVLPRAR